MALIGEMKYLTIGDSTYTIFDTTYNAGTGLSLNGTTINHSNSIVSGTAGTPNATSGATLAVPYVMYDAQGHVTATGTHTHTISGFLTAQSTLDASKLSGLIPSSCLPAYVDEILEYSSRSNFPTTGTTGKIYVDLATGKSYRWSGSSYVEISQSSTVTVSRDLTSGTKSATISVNGVDYDIYSVTNTDIVYSDTNNDGNIVITRI